MDLLRNSLARCRSGFVAAGAFSFVINVLMLTVSVYMMQVFDRVLTSQSINTLVYLTLLALGALAAMGVMEVLRSRILVRIGTWIDRVLSPAILTRGLANAARGEQYRTEGLRDIATLRNFLGGGGTLALFDSPWVPVYVGFVYILHPTLGHVALGGAVVLFILGFLTDRATRRPLKQANAAAAGSMRAAESAFRNVEVIEGMGMTGALARRWDSENSFVLHLQAVASDRSGLISGFTKFFRLFLQIAILGAGAWLVLKHELSAGGMIAASIIMGRALAPVEQAIGTWKHTVAAREAWKRLSELFRQEALHPKAMRLPRPQGHLTVEGLTYTPPGCRLPVLRGVAMEALPGEVLAVIGPSAAGKSTLARLIVGIGKPQTGCVRLDGADVYSWDRERFGEYVGYLPQDVELFPGTIRENIARMQEGEPDLVMQAAQLAGVHDMILRLPEGYETLIGEPGGSLSGGQRQRIGLARALYNRPSLLVLDEPNASLDAAGEEALNDAIAAVKALGTTVVLVAHRPSLMAHVDRVAVLHEGQMQMFGPRNAVLAQLQRPAAPPAAAPHVRAVN